MTRIVLAEIRRRHVEQGRPMGAALEIALRADPRAGAKIILQAVARRRSENRSEGQRLRRLLRYENALWTSGVLHVAGVDEAGMSPLAGPVAAAAVVFAPGSRIPGVDDSKKLDAATRQRLAMEIKETALTWSVGFAEVEEIDSINIYWAGMLAMRRAVAGLRFVPEHLLIDARRIKDMSIPQQPIVKGDAKSLTIAAASILAKTARDTLMTQARYRLSGIWLCETQRLSRSRAPRGDEPAGRYTQPSPVVRASQEGSWPTTAAAMAGSDPVRSRLRCDAAHPRQGSGAPRLPGLRTFPPVNRTVKNSSPTLGASAHLLTCVCLPRDRARRVGSTRIHAGA